MKGWHKITVVAIIIIGLISLAVLVLYQPPEKYGKLTSEETSWAEWRVREEIESFQLLTTDEFNERVNDRLERGIDVCIYYDKIEEVKWTVVSAKGNPLKWVIYTAYGYYLG